MRSLVNGVGPLTCTKISSIAMYDKLHNHTEEQLNQSKVSRENQGQGGGRGSKRVKSAKNKMIEH